MEATLTPAPPARAATGALVFVGFMGAGKTSGARAVAAQLGLRAIDSDIELERSLGMSVEDFFAARGERAFREREEALVCRLLEEHAGAGTPTRPAGVISLGGGAVGSERVRAALGDHTVVLLGVDAETAWRRASGRGRPLARDRARFRALYGERAALYERVADAIVPTGGREAARRVLPALLLARRMPAGTRLLWATSASGDYPVFVGAGVLRTAVWPAPGRRLCVSDDHVAPLWASRVPGTGTAIVVPAGERHKTLATAERVLRQMAAAGATRDDHVVALGGGVVGDVAGFCAAVYQRGIPVVQVPTTLVAQVDSAYGGKTGVDLPEGKNYVGAYHQPAAVLADTDTLDTLPPAEVAAGWAEVVKTALIAGGALWRRVREGAPVDRDLVLACARTKLEVVAEDERDTGRRQVLNLGHTVGHAIETATRYARYRHGEAVGLGLLAALRLSGQEALRAEVADLLARRGLPTTLAPDVSLADVAAATARDKKRRGAGPVPFVLLEEPGRPRTGATVGDDELRAALEELRG